MFRESFYKLDENSFYALEVVFHDNKTNKVNIDICNNHKEIAEIKLSNDEMHSAPNDNRVFPLETMPISKASSIATTLVKPQFVEENSIPEELRKNCHICLRWKVNKTWCDAIIFSLMLLLLSFGVKLADMSLKKNEDLYFLDVKDYGDLRIQYLIATFIFTFIPALFLYKIYNKK